MAHGGACVAQTRMDASLFVRHAAPGEITARVTAVQKKLARADAVEVLSASDDRVESNFRQVPNGGGELALTRPATGSPAIAGQVRRVGAEALAELVDALGECVSRPRQGMRIRTMLAGRLRIDAVIDEAGRAGMHMSSAADVRIALPRMPLAVPATVNPGLFDEGSRGDARGDRGTR